MWFCVFSSTSKSQQRKNHKPYQLLQAEMWSTKCVENRCLNFGNPSKRGYCNEHAAALNIEEVGCPYEICHTERLPLGNVNPEHGHKVLDDGRTVELPPGYVLARRSPVVGDKVITLCECKNWLSNSEARVAEVYPNGDALIHLACYEVYRLRPWDFVVIE